MPGIDQRTPTYSPTPVPVPVPGPTPINRQTPPTSDGINSQGVNRHKPSSVDNRPNLSFPENRQNHRRINEEETSKDVSRRKWNLPENRQKFEKLRPTGEGLKEYEDRRSETNGQRSKEAKEAKEAKESSEFNEVNAAIDKSKAGPRSKESTKVSARGGIVV